MDAGSDAQELIFKAEARGRIFGIMVARNGRATALTSRTAMKDVLTTQAMTWLIEQNPWPGEEVRFSLVSRFDASTLRGHSS